MFFLLKKLRYIGKKFELKKNKIMQQKVSIKWNIIKYDRNTLAKKIEEILNSRFENLDDLDKGMDDLHDPYLLIDMDKAVKRIKKAKKNNEKVIIFGDYDVDWVTSTSILMHFFKTIDINASYRLPHRITDGYGLKSYFIDELKNIWVTLIVTVDCGTSDNEVIEYAKKLWIDIIVTDHHTVPDKIPKNAIAVINPKRIDCNYLYKWLAWVWVVFKLISALAREYFDNHKYNNYLKETIDIVAIWTVADCMELTWENRIIVREWLKQIKNSRSKWLRRLIEDKINDDLDADVFSFSIAPKLNAAWRVDTPYKALNLILNTWESLNKTIREIEKLNEERKYLTKEFCNDAMNKVNRDNNIIFYISPAIHHWIVGIVAWRITEQLYKPSIVLKDEWDTLVASCRSPEYFSIINILEKYKESFIRYWWHAGAAWFSIKKEDFGEFKSKITAELNATDFSKYKKELLIDKVVKLDELWFNFLDKVNIYKPYWIWNLKPLFLVENLDYIKLDFLWQARDHLRFTTKHWFKIFWFFMWDYYEQIKRWNKVHLIFDISEDSWMWNKNLMLKIVDLIVE